MKNMIFRENLCYFLRSHRLRGVLNGENNHPHLGDVCRALQSRCLLHHGDMRLTLCHWSAQFQKESMCRGLFFSRLDAP